MKPELATLNERGLDTALAIHRDAVRVYEEAWNAHTFDFESDVGPFIAPDVTIVSEGMLGGRSALRELSDARAEYVRNSNVTVTVNLNVTCVVDLDTTVVVVAEGDFSFTYPDRTKYAQQMLISSTLRLLGGSWVFQHIHCG